MSNRNVSASGKRHHIVLIPGFGGFDALGRVNYYAGVTDLFNPRPGQHPPPGAVLHYFENLPTAAVVTRAQRLRNYLAKRIARGEIRDDDDIILIGHSTGGLDIRQLICDLHPSSDDARNAQIRVDGVHRPIRAKQLRDRIKKVVFLSVPHWGTNIAEWVYKRAALRKTVICDLRAAFEGSQHYPMDRIEACLAGGAAALTGAEVFLALRDALTEANYDGSHDLTRIADALEAASKLELYFREMASDFHVIHDLTPESHSNQPSPAHFSPKQRKEELELWDSLGIQCRSYATVGGRAFTFPPGCPAPEFNLTNPLVDLQVAYGDADTDISYRLCYRACAGGPLQPPGERVKITGVLGPPPPEPLKLWDNDGIVNTVSMLWPRGEIWLVQADHMDIVGHFRLMPPKNERHYTAEEPPPVSRSYDILRSAPKFEAHTFETVWREIFDFAATPHAYRPAATGLHKPVAIAAAASGY